MYVLLEFLLGLAASRACITTNLIRQKIQGADDKLGQFLDQGIWATAYHRNILQVLLKSCASLVCKQTYFIFKNM